MVIARHLIITRAVNNPPRWHLRRERGWAALFVAGWFVMVSRRAMRQ